MLKKHIRVGSTYTMNHSSGLIPVRILREVERFSRVRGGGERCLTHWAAVNLKTGREIEVKSAAKLLREMDENPLTPNP